MPPNDPVTTYPSTSIGLTGPARPELRLNGSTSGRPFPVLQITGSGDRHEVSFYGADIRTGTAAVDQLHGWIAALVQQAAELPAASRTARQHLADALHDAHQRILHDLERERECCPSAHGHPHSILCDTWDAEPTGELDTDGSREMAAAPRDRIDELTDQAHALADLDDQRANEAA